MASLPTPGGSDVWGANLNAAIESLHLTGTHAARPTTSLTVGTLYSCTDHRLVYRWDGAAWATWAGVQPNAKVSSSVALSIAHATTTFVTFNTELADTNGMVDLATASDRITITVPGLYLLVSLVDWQANNTGLRFVNIFQNGAPIATDRRNAANEAESSIAAIAPAVAGDYFRLQVYQDSGVALNTNANGATLAAVRVSA